MYYIFINLFLIFFDGIEPLSSLEKTVLSTQSSTYYQTYPEDLKTECIDTSRYDPLFQIPDQREKHQLTCTLSSMYPF